MKSFGDWYGRQPIAAKTRMLLLMVSALSVTVVFAVFYTAWTTFTIRLRTDELSRQTRVIASGLEDVDPGELGETRERFLRIEAGLIGATVVVTDRSGEVLVASDPALEGRTVPVDRLPEPDPDGVRSMVTDVGGQGRVLAVAVPVGAGDTALLISLQPVREVNRTRGWTAALLAASALAAMLVAWSGAGWFARRLTGPLTRLDEAAGRIASGEWGRTVDVEGDDEIGRLAASFNRMSQRVAAAYRSQKEFVGNVSHEMRTPVTTIAGFSQALLDGTVSGEEETERYLGVIKSEAERLGAMAAALLRLADVEAGAVAPDIRVVDLGRVTKVLLERFGATARDGGKSLRVELAGEVAADEDFLTQALSALVENAVRYSPPGSEVRVSAGYEDGAVLLAVEDSGPGVPVESRAKVFERFARLDGSRSKKDGGSGLGLALCKTLVEVQGGRVWVEDSTLGGAKFIIQLPGATPDSI